MIDDYESWEVCDSCGEPFRLANAVEWPERDDLIFCSEKCLSDRQELEHDRQIDRMHERSCM